MRHSEFEIGGEFTCGGRRWRCTDVGSRMIAAIPIEDIELCGSDERLDHETASAMGLFEGPPYGVAELVFDEDDFPACEAVAMDAASTWAP